MLTKILFHPSIFAVLFLGAFLLNTYVVFSDTIGFLLMILYFSVYGFEIGTAVARQEKGLVRWWIGCVTLLSLIMLSLSAAYYFATVPKELAHLLILLTPPCVGFLRKHARTPTLFERFHQTWKEHKHKIPRSVFVGMAILLLTSAILTQKLASSGITDAVRSPWERLDGSILLLFGISALLLFAMLIGGKQRALLLPASSVVLFLFIALALLVFPIGYGFDSFIHRATEQHIAQFGTITPKPFYYIGQYALVLFLHHGFLFPIDIADAFVLPVLTAVLLPMAWYSAAVHITKKRDLATTTLIGLFFIPLSSFIVTTPQGLANLLTLLLILSSVPYLFESERPRLWFPALLALLTLIVHPIAGLPAVLYFALLCVDPDRAPVALRNLARGASIAILGIASVILPASFLMNSMLSGQTLTIKWSALNPLYLLAGLNLHVFFENQFNPLLDFAYVYGKNALLILTLVSLVAWLSYHKDLPKRTRIPLLIALALSVNYLIMKTAVDFSFLISYERLNYADRLLPLAAFFLLPFFLLGIGHFFSNLNSRPLALKAAVIVLAAASATSAFYMAYPRRDAYETSRAFNTSAADIAAVQLIEQWANGEPYIALANQSVSAAAIKEIGFRYYGSLFFYPIPTGEALYEQFLKMNETPTREVARTALDLVPMHGDVFSLFFSVNDYWWDAPRIVETAKTTANDWRAAGGVHIFRYDFKSGSL